MDSAPTRAPRPRCTAAAARQALEDANRALEAEVGELRALQEEAADAGNAREMARELRVRARHQTL